jgi:uncharacterized protein
MTYRSRLLEDKLRAYHAAFPCVVVVGARQVGKTTLINHLFSGTARSFTFDPVQDQFGARQDPDLFLRNHPPPIILDEIQYAPELVPAIKRAIDRDRRPGQFLLTGSQQWSVMKSLAESLAGRAAILELSGFSINELYGQPAGGWLARWLAGSANDVEHLFRGYGSARTRPAERIWRGSFPEVQGLSEDVVPGWFLGYTSTYLQRDVRLALEARDEGQFTHFLALCAAMTAQEVIPAQWGRDLGLAHTTARRWLDVLRGTYQWIELPALTRNRIKRVSQRAKGHIADTGLACHLMRMSSPSAVPGHPAFGALFESLVVGDCLRQAQRESTVPGAWHYRRHSGAEVDLVFERDGRYFPIEVKASSNPTPRDAQGITVFQEDHGPAAAPGLVVHAGDRLLKLTERCWAVPFDLIAERQPDG